MNMPEMVDVLALRVNDADKTIITDAFKKEALNNGQFRLADLLHDNYLTELQHYEEDETLGASGDHDITSDGDLSFNVFRGGEGIIAVNMVTSGLWAIKTDFEDIKRTENKFYKASTMNPQFYIFQNTLYVLPAAAVDIDIYYMKLPARLQYNYDLTASGTPATTTFIGDAGQGIQTTFTDFYKGALIYSVDQESYHIVTGYNKTTREFTVSPAADAVFATGQEFRIVRYSFDALDHIEAVYSELNEALHELIVTLAEAECWLMDSKLDRRTVALEAVYREVGILNSRYQEATGIGTKG